MAVSGAMAEQGVFRETYRSFVNTWECDENEHMNVQFYFRAFQQASEIFALQADNGGERGNPGARTAIVRHVRYHRELHAARSTLVRSAVLGEGPAAGSVVHKMFDAESGTLSATALDQPGYRTAGLPVCGEAETREALPRGLAAGPNLPVATSALLERGEAMVSHRGVVRSEETGPDGDILSNAIISRFTDGAPHVWTFAGIPTDWLTRTRHGRVAVEMKLTRFARVEAGQALALVSWIGAMEDKTFVMRHQIEDMVTGEAVAAGEARALVMNLETRRAVPVPEFAREAFAARQM